MRASSRRVSDLPKTRWWHWGLFLVGFLHASAFALIVPLWQAPDEPGHVEYACLLGELGRPLTGDDISLRLQGEIIGSLARHGFWTQVQASWPAPLPLSFTADPFLARSGRQVGDEPPLYYLFPALICRSGLSIEARVRLIRLFGALLFGLTGVVAAWGLRGEGRQVNSPAPPVHQSTTLPFLPLLLVLLPMPAFIAGSANNDALAMLTATAVFAAVLRIQRLGWTWRRAAGLLLLVALALASKKTNSFLVPWLALLGLAAAWREISRHGLRQHALTGLAIGTAVTTAILLLPSAAPASWRSTGGPWATRRVAAARADATRAPGTWAVLIVDNSPRSFERMIQTLTGQKANRLRGQTVIATAWVRSPDGRPAPGRLTLRDTSGYSQTSFVTGEQWEQVAIARTVALTTTHIKLAIAPGEGHSEDEVGRLWVGGITLASRDGEPSSSLLNADFARAARWGELLLVAPLEDRWQQFAPRHAAGEEMSAAELKRYGLYALLTFAGFWGNFGWLQHPLPVWVYAILAVVCLLAAAGVLRVFRHSSSESFWISRGIMEVWLLAVALAAAQAFLPMLGRPWQPQGRYLFPVLLPIAGLLLAGLDAWLDFDGHPHRLAALLGCETALAMLCLAVAATA